MTYYQASIAICPLAISGHLIDQRDWGIGIEAGAAVLTRNPVVGDGVDPGLSFVTTIQTFSIRPESKSATVMELAQPAALKNCRWRSFMNGGHINKLLLAFNG